jgi:hypothetical protein
MSDQLVLILVIVGGAIGMFLVAIAMFMMRQETPAKTDAPTEAEAQPAETTATDSATTNGQTAPTPEPASSPTSWLNTLASRPSTGTSTPAALLPLVGGEELMRLWRSAEGELIIDVQGKRHRTRQDLIDAGVEMRVNQAINDLGVLLSGPASASVSSTVEATPVPQTHQNALASLLSPNLGDRPVQKVSLEEASKIEIKKPTMDISTQFRYLRGEQKKPEIQVKSVAEEINEILQDLILDTPYVKRGLKMGDGKHGVVFSLDGRNYDSVDDLPEEECRVAVRAAIKKWDKR